MSKPARTRLQPEDWIKAAFRALVRDGSKAVNAESLARDLGTTKGSFYWHFRDVPALHLAMLGLWEKFATDEIVARVDATSPPGVARLNRLTETVSDLSAESEFGGFAVEPAIRDWARSNNGVAKALLRVDTRRNAYVTKLFNEAGLPAKQAAQKAELFYGGFVGLQTLAVSYQQPFDNQMRRLLKELLRPD